MADVVVLGLRVNNEPVEALTRIVRRGKADALGRQMVRTMKEEIERQVFDVILQASHGPSQRLIGRMPLRCDPCLQATAGSRIIARETVKAVRKNVTAKCYGGDVSRKKKLLNKQKEGKKRRAQHVGNVPIPHKAFLAVLAPSRRSKR